jgi:LysR family glycine cleavage system transcriptional activator
MNSYPPLKSLLVFDAAMRTHSFSVAAAELYVTPGAVGQQIRKLEGWLGVALFVREVRQVVPTEEARAYWQRIQPALAEIADASRKVRDSRSMAVRLSMPPSFAAKWFTTRMAGLLTRYPGLELHLNASVQLVDFERDAVDLAIRYFDGKAPQLDATLLCNDEARVYCTPAYAAGLGLREPDDLQRATLLVTTMQPFWERWLGEFSRLAPAVVAALPRIHFDQGLMAIEAAKQGQGAVISSPLLVAAELAEGLLCEPFGLHLPLANAYYVVHHAKLPLRHAATLVKEWLVEEAAAGSGG